MKICIIPCGSKKIYDVNPFIKDVTADKLYVGSFHSLCKRYSKYISDEYCILSAKHGFIFPEDIIEENYNVTFNDKKTNPISIQTLKQQLFKFEKYNSIICLCGRRYHDIIESVFDRSIENRLKGLKGMGYMVQYMTNEINKLNGIDLF